MISRRGFVEGSLALLAAPAAADAQQAGKIYRVGVLWGGSEALATPYKRALEGGLRELGWVIETNIRFEHRFPESPDRVPQLAAELVALKPDIIVAAVNPVIEIVKAATSTIPIVMLYAVDPVGSGLVQSLARSGGNVTRLSFDAAPSLIAKGVEFLRETLPKARRVAILWSPSFFAKGALRAYPAAINEACREVAITPHWVVITGPEDIETAFREVIARKYDAIYVMGDTFVSFRHYELIGRLASHGSTPSFYPYRRWVDAGGLMSYGPNIAEMPRYIAGHIDKILKGAKPAGLPVEQPTKFELVVNLKTAKALGLTIPPSLLLRADQVIE